MGLLFITLPPHCSHKLQPFDVSIYGPFKRYYNSACNDWMLSHPGRAITIYDIGSLSAQAYYKAFTSANIIAGFNKTGIYPMNMGIFSDDAFLSSAPTYWPDQNVQSEPSTSLQPQPWTSIQPQSLTSLHPHPSTSLQPQPTTSLQHRPSTSFQVQSSATDVEQRPFSPEMVRPFPKAPERNQNSRKKQRVPS